MNVTTFLTPLISSIARSLRLTAKSCPKAAPSTATAPCFDSRALAKLLGIQHQSVFGLIKTYPTDFKAFGALEVKSDEPEDRGRPEKYALLNQDHIKLLLAYSRNTDQARAVKMRWLKNQVIVIARAEEEQQQHGSAS